MKNGRSAIIAHRWLPVITEIDPNKTGPVVAATLLAKPLNPKNSNLFSSGTSLLNQERATA